jgi:hypothetical protein
MGVQKKTRKFAVAKRTIQLRDSRLSVILAHAPQAPQGSSYSPRFRKANDKDKNDKAGNSGKDEVVREA